MICLPALGQHVLKHCPEDWALLPRKVTPGSAWAEPAGVSRELWWERWHLLWRKWSLVLIASAQCLNRWLHFNMTAMCLSKECHPTVQLSEWAHTQCCRVPPKSTKFKYLSYYNWHAWEHKKWHNWTAGILFFKIITCSFSWILFFSLNTLRYKLKTRLD